MTENSLLCVGLDPDFNKLPDIFKKSKTPLYDFNKSIIDATAPYVGAFKPNSAFYEARGEAGMRELRMTFDYLNETYPDIFTILDAKRADIGNTNNGYATMAFDWLDADAVTLHPYLGQEAIQPFLDRTDKTSIILCRTSNPGAGEFQDLKIYDKALWQVVAEQVASKWNKNNNCMLVVGATYPEELAIVRKVVGEMTILVPGIGAQGGDLEKVMAAGLNSQKAGLLINSSRGIIFAADPAAEAKKLCEQINQLRK